MRFPSMAEITALFHTPSQVQSADRAPKHNLPHGAFALATNHGTLQIEIGEQGVKARFPQMLQYGWSHISPADVEFEKAGSAYVARYNESHTFDAWAWSAKSGYQVRDYRLELSRADSGALQVGLQTFSTRWKKLGYGRYEPGQPSSDYARATLRPQAADAVY